MANEKVCDVTGGLAPIHVSPSSYFSYWGGTFDEFKFEAGMISIFTVSHAQVKWLKSYEHVIVQGRIFFKKEEDRTLYLLRWS